jgi:signal transduction histidine kinase
VDAHQLQWGFALIERQVQHMSRLLDDLLEVSRITTGKLELRKERVVLQTVLDTSVETALPLIQAKRHRLSRSPVLSARGCSLGSALSC